MKNSISSVISQASSLPFITVKVLNEAKERIKKSNLIREENPYDHFCSFIVPFDRKAKKIFLGHHIKANCWIPPGGHIERDETPIAAAVREAQEELGITISEKDLELFTIDWLDVSSPNKVCKIHWHIWYVFETQEKEYDYDNKEFYDAGWFSVAEGLKKMRIKPYREILRKLLI